MIGIAAVGSFLMYGLLYIIPIKPFVWVFERYQDRGRGSPTIVTHTHTHIHRIFFLNPGGKFPPLRYRGGWLLTSPEEDFDKMQDMAHFQLSVETSDTGSHTNLPHATKTKVKNQWSHAHSLLTV